MEEAQEALGVTSQTNMNKGSNIYSGHGLSGLFVSTNLSVHDQTWPTSNAEPHQILRSSTEMREEIVAYNIGQMKHYWPGEEEAETRTGVSTKLKLFPYSWDITKKLTPTDLNDCSRLLVPAGVVDTHFMPLLDPSNREKVETGRGLHVPVWDLDTNSNHHLVFKKWLSSNSYVFIGNWRKEFVRRRQLVAGDQIGMCWDSFYSKFNFCLLGRTSRI